ncbi:MAG: hypothetical protein ACI83Y_002297 [Candidatus Azotimanducaceae bacterium]|jgi:hypothetical protein|tara:strand:+ start:2164 stop:2742 length:579 start_codon:yes stop_codon:yes gene_type:complete
MTEEIRVYTLSFFHRRQTMAIATVIAAGIGLLLASDRPAEAGIVPAATTAIVSSSSGLSITVPANAGNLGTAANTVGGSTISGQLGEVQVNDARILTSGWVATAISTAFTPALGPAIASSNVGYSVGPITKVATAATYTANDPADLSAVSPVVTATGVLLFNSATWNPTINVTVPGGTLAGVYVATITHSVT